LESGKWIDFYPDEKIRSVSLYKFGRLSGPFTLYYNDGTISQQGNYEVDMMEGKLESFYPNKKLSSSGSYMDNYLAGEWKFWDDKGKLTGEYVYEGDIVKTLNVWDSLGNQTIKDGNGVFKTFYPDGKPMEAGHIKDGYKSGPWKTYFNNGILNEEGEFKDNVYYIKNASSSTLNSMIKDGEGKYNSDETSGFQQGTVHKGLRVGEWILKKMESDSVPSQTLTYRNGKLNGKQKTFFENGQVSAEGDLKDNKREGTWFWYHKNGRVESFVFFEMEKKKDSNI